MPEPTVIVADDDAGIRTVISRALSREGYGVQAACGRRAFPRPGRLAAVGEAELRQRVRAGYRAPMLAQLPGSLPSPSRSSTSGSPTGTSGPISTRW